MRIGFPELIVVFIVALVVIGPDKLPLYAKKFGAALREFRSATNDVTSEIKKNVVEPINEAKEPLREAVKPFEEVTDDINASVKDLGRAVNDIGKEPVKKEKPELTKQEDGTYVGYYELKPEDMYNAKGELLTGETVLSCKDSADQSAREADTVNVSFTSETKLIQDALASVKISSVSPAEGVVGPVTREGKDVYSGNVNITFDDGLNSSVNIGASGAAGSGKSYVVSATAGANEEHDVSFTASFTTPHGVTKSKTIDKSVESKL
ncbi:MAG: twin-arginine translocase TatA/TatE family subunit, partial [Lachnospiraceae bacterium]|nr:twin-arginine translocase TatA/TatE family subunit [Lachnospiraceae bacterium]